MKNPFFGQSLVSADDLSLVHFQLLSAKTQEMEKLVKKRGGDKRLLGKILAALFFEPSTRTFSSFITAMQRLGGGIIPLSGMAYTSVAKGESFAHTIKVLAVYADCLVLRHPEKGAADKAAAFSSVPVINAGDGSGEHPTQALLDAYTIKEIFGRLEGLKIALVGDLKFGRTVHSLAKLLAKIAPKAKLYFVSPKALIMPEEIKSRLKENKVFFQEKEKLEEVISQVDVLYMTRVQKERFKDQREYERLKSFYQVSSQTLTLAKKKMILMHPLPIAAGEIHPELDNDFRSVYLNKQLSSGLYLRMALLDLILRG